VGVASRVDLEDRGNPMVRVLSGTGVSYFPLGPHQPAAPLYDTSFHAFPLRSQEIRTPALILSALGEVDDRVKGLRAGGDDYLTKPYAFSELLARIEALARRTSPEEGSTRFVVGDLVLDRLSHKVTRAGEAIMLQPREFRLLEYLMKHAGQVVTRTMLLENVWDYHFDPQTNVIDVHISRLRSKIDKNFGNPLLHTVRGAGYTIRDSAH